MKQPLYFILGLMVVVAGFVLVAVKQLFAAGLAVLALGVVLLVHWNTVNFRWVCDHCRERFAITMWQNFTGINGGIRYKYLRCPRCGRRRWCRGE